MQESLISKLKNLKMKIRFKINGFVIVLIFIGFSSCVNLQHVNNYASTSMEGLTKFEAINYGFKQNCQEDCIDKAIVDLNLNSKICDCKENVYADSATFVIYNSIKEYFRGLISLSDNKNFVFKIDTLTKALKEGDFGSIKIEKGQLDAFTNISNNLLSAATEKYRQKKIELYVKNANAPLKVLITYLGFNLSANLYGKLNTQKEYYKHIYFVLVKDTTLSTYEKRKAVEEYYQHLRLIEERQKLLLTYSNGLKIIEEGHQKLFDDIDQLTKDKIKKQLDQYSSDIKNIFSKFINKK